MDVEIIQSRSVKIIWNHVRRISHYEIQWSDSRQEMVNSSSVAHFTLTNLLPSTNYSVTVKRYFPHGKVEWSEPRNVTTLADGNYKLIQFHAICSFLLYVRML